MYFIYVYINALPHQAGTFKCIVDAASWQCMTMYPTSK